MIIKDKPFRVPACQAMLCWFHASPVVVGVSIRALPGCEVDVVRRWPVFPKLEAYQKRLSRYLVMRRSDVVFVRNFDVLFDYQFEVYFEARRAGGVL